MSPSDDPGTKPGALRTSLAERRARALRSGQMHPASPPHSSPAGLGPRPGAPTPVGPAPRSPSVASGQPSPASAAAASDNHDAPGVAGNPEALARQRIAQGQRLQAHLRGEARTAAPGASEPRIQPPPPNPAEIKARFPTEVEADIAHAGATRAEPCPPLGPEPGHKTDAEAVQARIAARAADLRAEVAALRSAPVPAAAPGGLSARLGTLRRSVGLDDAHPASAPETPPGAASQRHRVDEAETTPLSPRAAWQAGASDRHRAIARVLPGSAQATAAGHTWRIRSTHGPDHHHGDHPLDLAEAHARAWLPLLAEDLAWSGLDPRRALYFDLETTGLDPAHTLPFLTGAAFGHSGGYTLEQWLLRSPEEEPAALLALAERVAEADWLVSFNGRAFDAPVLSARYRAHGLANPFAPEVCPPHLDLLPLSRRLLAEHLPNARLGTLEVHHLGLRRIDDVPGSAVPARYAAWLAEGEAEALADVVRHNADDIWSLITLLGVLLKRVAEAPSLVLRAPKAALRVAKAAERLQPAHAEAIYRAAEAFPDTVDGGTAGLARMARAERRRLRKQPATGHAGTGSRAPPAAPR